MLDGPLKKVANPKRMEDIINVNRLSIHFGNFWTIIMAGMYVIGIIVNMKPTCCTDNPKS